MRFTSKKSGCARTCVLFLLFFIALFIVPVAAGVDLVSFLPTLSNLKKKKNSCRSSYTIRTLADRSSSQCLCGVLRIIYFIEIGK